MSVSKVITLLFIGVAVGILIAPAKGSKTRKKLSKLVNDVSDSMEDIIDLFRREANDLSDEEAEHVENSIANQ